MTTPTRPPDDVTPDADRVAEAAVKALRNAKDARVATDEKEAAHSEAYKFLTHNGLFLSPHTLNFAAGVLANIFLRRDKEYLNRLTAETAARERAEAMLKKHEYGWGACDKGNGSCSPQCPECELEFTKKHDYSAQPTDYMHYCELANIIKNTPEAPDAG